MQKHQAIKLILALIFAIISSNVSFAQQASCDYKVEILIDAEEFKAGDFKWRMRAVKIEGKSTNITGTAKIADSDNKTVKTYKPWTNDSIAKQKTSSEYSPNLKPGEYEITAEISVECDDTNKDNDIDTKNIKIKESIIGTGGNESTNQGIETKAENTLISDVNSEPIQTNTIKNTTKTADEETGNTIQLTNKNAQKTQELQPITSSIKQAPQIVYESSGERAKTWIMIFLLALSVLFNIILIWKR